MHIQKLVTLGPKSLNKETISQIDEYGIFVFRINLSHTPFDKLEETISRIREFSDTPICLDSEGGQVRNGSMKKGNEVNFKKGSSVKIHFDSIDGDHENISFTPDNFSSQLVVGDIIHIDFHGVRLLVDKVNDKHCQATVISSGKVGSNKAVDLNREIKLPAITKKDEQSIELGRRMGIKHFALSFAESGNEVDSFRSLIGSDSFLISKVESKPGLLNLEDISDKSDAILIDRGDLSRQVPIEKIPFFQRRIISVVRSKRKMVYVATNLLETMVTTRKPSRAEVNDVISTLEMGANGLVLAGETAAGDYPVDCVNMISKLISQFEHWTTNTSIKELL